MPYRVAIVPGDGIGQEVIPAAVRVLEATGLAFEFVPAEAGWATFERLGIALPQETIDAVRECTLALFGAVSSPARKVPGYRSPIVALRRELDLYANLRPARSAPIPSSRPGINLLLVRENTEGLYAGRERREGDTAVAERVITRQASQRIGRLACELAARRRGHLTIVHKANILPETCGLFRDAVRAASRQFPGLEVDECLVDTMALRLVQAPQAFDVVVTTNLFGDILSDEAAALVGGLGLAPAANVGEEAAVFEPVHGSAPDIAGRGVANPVAAILAAAMLLDHVGEQTAAAGVRQAVWTTLERGPRTPDLGGTATTAEVTEAVIGKLAAPA
ncbi:MAG: isocitrate/isopropylmalate dehydrogenase family protein [Anaerolineae bacterium]|nr:isocitrate/isopropylmalate dehydrogenase family protein [Anaerolineae bacterium]